MFKGSMTALITPFKNGNLDEEALARFVDWQISEGTHGLVPTGTTGESPTLDYDEHKRVIEITIDVARKRVPVMAGTGSNSTDEAIELSTHAQKAGADALLIVTPYYNKPTQEGLYQHFKAVHDATDLPIIIYNIPPRSVVDMTIETMKRLAELPRIVGVKDATADLARPLRTRVEIGADFLQFSGEDATVGAFMAQGGHGVISVASNIAPRLMSDWVKAFAAGDMAAYARLRDRLLPLHLALFCETSPQPAKYALSKLGFGSDFVRLPLVPASANARARIDAALQALS